MLQKSTTIPPEKNTMKPTTVSAGSPEESWCNKENHMGTVDSNKKYLANMKVSDVSL